MSKLSKLKKSRDQWKEKAGKRADENRYYRKELERVKTERDHLKKSQKKQGETETTGEKGSDAIYP